MGIIINQDILEAIDDYHEKSLKMQNYHFDHKLDSLTKYDVDDDLIYNVPIYDMLDRRYAAFSSFLEAIYKTYDDPKGNGKYFAEGALNANPKTMIYLFYLFRLCGSGINYIPKTTDNPFGTHGFGNFWIVDLVKEGDYDPQEWMDKLREINKPFTNNKGYLLPQFSYKNQTGGHLKRFILEESLLLVDKLYEFLRKNKPVPITQAVDYMNIYLKEKGFKKQNFVLSATMADVAEYYPSLVDPNSMIYAGTNAKKCINLIFKKDGNYQTNLQFESECIQFLADRYNSTPYSVEDSRLCDVIRYFKEYQSDHHIKKNHGIIMKNNSILKRKWGLETYKKFVSCM
tara:strand:- start:2590 stop:3618 length:1029 start_codon:yes stop_codon:yes gene_type:complete